jgi:hypothetical protein
MFITLENNTVVNFNIDEMLLSFDLTIDSVKINKMLSLCYDDVVSLFELFDNKRTEASFEECPVEISFNATEVVISWEDCGAFEGSLEISVTETDVMSLRNMFKYIIDQIDEDFVEEFDDDDED